MRTTRATIVGIFTGVLLLVVLAGFAIGLPKVEGALPTLPDRFDGGFVAISGATPADLGAKSAQDEAFLQQVIANAKDADKKNADHLSDLYGDATVRTYVDASGLKAGATTSPAQMSVAVVKGAAGLVIPSGPMQIDQNGQHYTLKKIDDYQCAVTYTDPQAATPTTPATGTTYLQTECRASANGLAYDVFATGLTPDKTAGYLHQVVGGDYQS